MAAFTGWEGEGLGGISIGQIQSPCNKAVLTKLYLIQMLYYSL